MKLHSFALPLVLLLLAGCPGPDDGDTSDDDDNVVDDDSTGDDDTADMDADGDGYTVGDGDCDDTDASIHPNRDESCNGVDDNCDGSLWDEEADADADGVMICEGDCDDAEAEVYPGHAEVCNDGLDNDCDGTDNGCAYTGTHSLANADAKLLGEAEADEACFDVTICDLDMDGYGDIVVGAPGQGSVADEAGAVYVVRGPVSGTSSLSAADARLYESIPDQRAGHSMDCSADANLDGYPDLLIGAFGSGELPDRGRVNLVHGPVSGDVALQDADAVFEGEQDGDDAGYSVAFAGDVNADDAIDVIIGARSHDVDSVEDQGAAYIVYGPFSGIIDLAQAEATLIGEEEDDQFGHHVGLAGDYDGDGLDDIFVTAAFHANWRGSTYLFQSPVEGETSASSAGAQFTGEQIEDRAGYWASMIVTDLDLDGQEDVVIGAPHSGGWDTSYGSAYVLFGSQAGSSSPMSADAAMSGDTLMLMVGWTVAAGDIDGEGRPDLAIGAVNGGINGGRGHVYVYYTIPSGSSTVSTADLDIEGELAGDNTGHAINIGAIDGDTPCDLLIGASTESSVAYGNGAAYVVYGRGL